MHQLMCFAIEATAPEFVAGQHAFRTELFNQLFYKFSSDTRRMACYFQSLKIGISDDDNVRFFGSDFFYQFMKHAVRTNVIEKIY